MKKIFKGHSPWGFLSFRHAENQEPPRYLTGYMPVKKIHKAASVGDIPQVQKMLEFGDIDVNITDRKKRLEGAGLGWEVARNMGTGVVSGPKERKLILATGMERGG